MTTVLRRSAALASGAVLALTAALAGCGEGDGSDSDGGGYGAPETGDVALSVADSSVGPILVDGEGMTLYLFTEDEAGAPTCYGQCAESWPPLTASDGVETGEELDPRLVGEAERDDGATQVTYNGHPLYHWAADAVPGELGGQGSGDVWFVLDPDGEAVTESG